MVVALHRTLALVCALTLLAGARTVSAAPITGAEGPQQAAPFSAVVKVDTTVPADARTAGRLGTEREGSGVVIDDTGLVLTIGYLMLEAESAQLTTADGRTVPASIIAYDHDTGFGLLRAEGKLGVRPIALGSSAALTPETQVLVVPFGGPELALPAVVVARRPFAGSWEYLIERAIFTSPPHPAFGGAALIDEHGALVGIGSLIVADAAAPGRQLPGNMFVPIDQLTPILGDLLAHGRASTPRHPWLGLSAEEVRGRLFVTRVARGGPAAGAGVAAGDLVLGVDGVAVAGLADFYRKAWAQGDAGAPVRVDILHGMEVRNVTIKSMDRHDWLKLRRSY